MAPLIDVDAQVVAILAGALLLSAVVLVWRGPLASPRWPLTLQGVALAALVAAIGWAQNDGTTLVVAWLVLLLKAVVLPSVVARQDRAPVGAGRSTNGASADRGPAAGAVADEPGDGVPGRGVAVVVTADPAQRLIAFAVLVVAAYLLARPLVAVVPGAVGRSLPVATALVLVGLLLLVTGRRAQGQLVGFLVLDNGIAATAFLATGGVPLVVELGVSLDVLLVVLVLTVLSARMRATGVAPDPDLLRELHD